jgi:hypothetical protein
MITEDIIRRLSIVHKSRGKIKPIIKGFVYGLKWLKWLAATNGPLIINLVVLTRKLLIGFPFYH